jgi:hypothetical protein
LREASARILPRHAARLDDAVERYVIQGDDLSQNDFSFCLFSSERIDRGGRQNHPCSEPEAKFVSLRNRLPFPTAGNAKLYDV